MGRKHSVFKRLVSQGRQKASLCWNGLNVVLLHCKIWHHPYFKHLQNDIFKIGTNIYKFPDFKGLENIVGKRENTGYQHFLLFPQCCQEPLL